MKKITLFFVCLIFAGVNALWAQNVQVSGVVTDNDGLSLPGVSVVVKGTRTSITADANGHYTISVPGDATLVFSFLGMKTQEEIVGGRTTINVIMESDARTLDEVVITSYGVAKKPTNTGAAINVSSEKVAAMPVTSFEKALQGNAAGVMSVASSGQPGSAQSVLIRGIGSISGSTMPLYVVDGVPIATGNYGQMTATGEITYSNNSNIMASLNPNDIETVTILKDAAATSIYGSRASNGVVMITTKRGKSGKTTIDFKASTGFSTRATKHFKVLGREDFLDLATDMLVNAGYSDATIDIIRKDGTVRTINSMVADQYTMRDLNDDFYDFDWSKEAYNDAAPTYTADLSVSGGNDKTKFYISGSYFNQEGIVKESWIERGSLRLNMDHQANKSFSLSGNILLSMTGQKTALTTSAYYTNPVFGALMYAPVDPGILSNGDIVSAPYTYPANFINNLRYNDIQARTYRVMPNVIAQLELFDGLFLKANVGLDFMAMFENQWDDHKCRGNTAFERGRSSSSGAENMVWNETVTLNYIKTLAENHNFNFMLGQEARKTDYRDLYAASEVFAPGLYEVSHGAEPKYTFGTHNQNTLASFFLNGNYDFNDKYYASASLRSDITSKFVGSNKSGIFWSVGASWKISNEEFMQSLSWINSLQLRASYGTSGNQSGIGNYASMGLFATGISNSSYVGKPGLYPYQAENAELTWEKASSFNIGLDFNIFKNRLNGTIEYYYRYTTDLLMSAQLSSTTGYTGRYENVGEISNQGIEVTLNAIPVQMKDFRWDVSLNISSNRNRVEKLYGGADIINGTRIYREGEDIQSVFTRPWAGINPADGRPMYYTKDGEICYEATDAAGAERKIIGSAAPDFFGGFTNKLSFYGVEISAMLYFTVGGMITDQTMLMFTSVGNRGLWNQHIQVNKRWKQEGDITDIPKALYGSPAASHGQMTSRHAYDGSYIRLRDITVAYNFPHSWTSKIKIENARIFVQGTNLFTLTTYPGMDPEVGLGGDYWYGYPMAKTITCGIQLKF
ncbi:MAG: TonB-dependent receptor [Prevotellaceae bacterium]|jgi:TonB-linked SusC/RagA family outer membrane protein|nr:TonB-dependent receptor [Prevotellaceae bacterium]